MVSKWWHEYQVVVEVVVVDDASVAKMSGGDVDVEPYLDSRNTIGHGNHNSKSQRPKHFKIDKGDSSEWWWCLESVGGMRK